MEETPKGLTEIEQKQMIEGDTTRLTQYWQLRNAQMQEDRDLINLIPQKKTTTDKAQWLTNEPKVFFDTSRALVSIYPPRFRLPIDINLEAEQKDKMNRAERLATGIYRTLDDRLAEQGGVSWLWELAYWTLLGWWSVFVMAEKTADGVVFKADLWEPMNVYPEWDSMGLKRCVRAYETDNMTAQAMAFDFQQKGLEFQYHEPDPGNQSKVINYWLRTSSKTNKPKIWNAILLNGVIVKPLTLQRGLHRIPVHIGSVGTPDRASPNWQLRRGEAITYSNRDMYRYRNTMISLMAEILASNTYPNMVMKLMNPNNPPFKPEDVKGHGTQLRIKPNEAVELLRHATTPEEGNILFQWTGQKTQEASLPATVYGSMPFQLSGFAISQYMATLKYKLGPYLNAMQLTLGRIMTDFLIQYKTGNFGPITLSTENSSDVKRGMTFLEEFTQKDVPERVYVETTIPITSQFDKTQQILNMRQALNPPQIYSRETLWEMDGDVQDFEVERERIKRDLVEQDPFVISMDIVSALWQRYEVLKLSNPIAAEALKKYIFLKEMEIGMRKGAPQTSAGGQGIPPNQMPPEAMASPDVGNAIIGQGPPGLSRRPQTPDERAASKGRKGVLLSPTGQTLM